jgi:hypothetical protein
MMWLIHNTVTGSLLMLVRLQPGFDAGYRSSPYCKEEWQDSCTDTAEVGPSAWHLCHSQEQQPQTQPGKNHAPCCVRNLPLMTLYRMQSGSDVCRSIQCQCVYHFDWASCSAPLGAWCPEKPILCELAPYEYTYSLTSAELASSLPWLFLTSGSMWGCS